MKKSKNKRHSLYLIISILLLYAFIWIVDQFTEITLPTEQKPIQFYATQQNDDLRNVVIRAIQGAKKSILLMIYALNDEQVIAALKEKSLEGIKITIICDAKASARLGHKLGKNVALIKRHSPGLMHLKIMVIDAIQTWIGSANYTPDSLRIHGNLLIGFHNSDLAKSIAEKAATMPSLHRAPAYEKKQFIIGTQKLELCFLPDHKSGVDCVTEVIKSAKKSVRVAMFTWTRFDLAKEIIAAQHRGIQASVVVDYASGKGASAKAVAVLLKGGVSTRLSDSQGLLHYKLLYVDGERLVHGSANWTLAAFTKNDDCFIILHDLTEDQRHFLDRLWYNITLESQSIV